jgi:hypothetical protein
MKKDREFLSKVIFEFVGNVTSDDSSATDSLVNKLERYIDERIKEERKPVNDLEFHTLDDKENKNDN